MHEIFKACQIRPHVYEVRIAVMWVCTVCIHVNKKSGGYSEMEDFHQTGKKSKQREFGEVRYEIKTCW